MLCSSSARCRSACLCRFCSCSCGSFNFFSGAGSSLPVLRQRGSDPAGKGLAPYSRNHKNNQVYRELTLQFEELCVDVAIELVKKLIQMCGGLFVQTRFLRIPGPRSLVTIGALSTVRFALPTGSPVLEARVTVLMDFVV